MHLVCHYLRHARLPVLAILLWIAPSPGETQDRYRAARILFEEGNTLAAGQDYKGALKKYQEARAIFPSPKIDVNIGTTLRALGYPARAAEHFAVFLRRADPRTDQKMVRAVRATLDELLKEVGSVTLKCRIAGAAVAVDGRSVGKTPLGHRIFLAPGTHRLSLTRSGAPEVVRTLALGKGDHQVVEVTWPAAARPVVRGTETTKTEGPGSRPVPVYQQPIPVYQQPISVYQQPVPVHVPPPPAPRLSTPVYKRWWFWTTVGVLMAGAAAGVVLATQYGGDDRLPSGEAGSMVLR